MATKAVNTMELFNGLMMMAHIFGVSFIEKKEDKDGKVKYGIKFKGTAKVDSDLRKAKAIAIINWINEANKSENGFEIQDIGKKILLDGDEIMFILEEVPLEDRDFVYKEMNKETKEAFGESLARIYVSKTKRMKFIRAWLTKVKPFIKKGGELLKLDEATKEKIRTSADNMNKKAEKSRNKNKSGNWFTRMHKL